MTSVKILLILMIISVMADILTLPIWALSSFFGGFGIPGLALTIWLLVLHIKTLRNIKKRTRVSEANFRSQLIAGTLLILGVGFIVRILSFEGDFTDSPILEVIRNVSIFVLPSIALLLAVLIFIKRYNSQVITPSATSNQEAATSPIRQSASVQ